MSQTVAEVVVETLQAAGVKHCWGVSGEPGQVFGTALYSAKALLGGRAGDVWGLALDNL